MNILSRLKMLTSALYLPSLFGVNTALKPSSQGALKELLLHNLGDGGDHDIELRSAASKKSSMARAILAGVSITLAAAISHSVSATDRTQLGVTDGNSPHVAPASAMNKYRPAPARTAIQGQYIIVLENKYIEQEASVIAGGRAVIADAATAAEFRAQAVASTAELMTNLVGGRVVSHYSAALAGFVAKLDKKGITALLKDPRIAFIEQDQVVKISATQNNATWGLDRIDQSSLPLDSQYTYDYDGSGVDAYIIDTGIRSTHQNFGGRVSTGFTAINDGNGTNDCNGHGTHVAGTVGSGTYGVAKNVSLIPVRVLDCNGGGTNSTVISGIDYVVRVASGPSVANMSLGGGASSAIDNALKAAVSAGVTFVVAAGNDTINACSVSPARAPEALTIAASTSSDARSHFSNYGSCVDMFAPGSNITSTWSTSNTATNTISGTSMAAPHVTGVVALYLDQNPDASPTKVESALKSATARNRISGAKGSPNMLVQSQPLDTCTDLNLTIAGPSVVEKHKAYFWHAQTSGSCRHNLTYRWKNSEYGNSIVGRDYGYRFVTSENTDFTISLEVSNGDVTVTRFKRITGIQQCIRPCPPGYRCGADGACRPFLDDDK